MAVERPEPTPDPELLKQYRELVTSDELSISSVKDLARYLRRQPPQSEDAVKVGDLIIKLHQSVRDQLRSDDIGNPDLEGYFCNCEAHMIVVIKMYELAILLNPDNPIPYERLAQEIDWSKGLWQENILKPISLRGKYDNLTLRTVMTQYQQAAHVFEE